MTTLLSKFLVLDKPLGMTSQRAISQLKRLFKLKKIGHTGTLDPLATGVLPLAIESATKVIPYLAEEEKIYQACGKLGESTNTYDAEGEVIESSPFAHLQKLDLEKSLQKFLGKITQRPPIFSAIKVKGKALYRYARKNEAVEIPLRQVTIDEIKLLDWKPPYFSLQIKCSRGTYIRSLIHDIGKDLGCGAHLAELKRLQSGIFKLEQALTLEQLQSNPELIETASLSIEDCLMHLDSIQLKTEQEAQKLENGLVSYSLQDYLDQFAYKDQVLRVYFKEYLIALLSLDGQGRVTKCRQIESRS